MVPYLEARTMVAEHVSATIEPHAPHMDNLAAPWSAPGVAAGVLAYPLPAEAPVPWIAVGDIADRIAAAIEGLERGRIRLCGPRPLTSDQAAEAIAGAVGGPVRYRALDPAGYGDLIRPYAGDALADGIAGLYTAMHSAPPPSFEGVQPCPTDMADWAARQAWSESLAA